MLPYEVDGTDLSFLKEHDLQDRQVSSLTADQDAAFEPYPLRYPADPYGWWTRAQRSRSRRTTMLGGSREAIIDTIRYLSGSSWPKLLARLSDDGIAVSLARKDAGPLRSRAVAEQLFEDAVRADTDHPDKRNPLATLVQALAKLAPASHRKLIKHVERGIANRGAT